MCRNRQSFSRNLLSTLQTIENGAKELAGIKDELDINQIIEDQSSSEFPVELLSPSPKRKTRKPKIMGRSSILSIDIHCFRKSQESDFLTEEVDENEDGADFFGKETKISSEVPFSSSGPDPLFQRRIHLSNLPSTVTENCVAKALRGLGRTASIEIIRDDDPVSLKEEQQQEMMITVDLKKRNKNRGKGVSSRVKQNNSTTDASQNVDLQQKRFLSKTKLAKGFKSYTYAFATMEDHKGFQNCLREDVRLLGISIPDKVTKTVSSVNNDILEFCDCVCSTILFIDLQRPK
jgi:hypothetical protein